jgi:hypothetical protein
MGYTNRDKRIVNVTAREKRSVRVLRRRAEKRELRGEHVRSATHATRRGWWYA